MPTLGSFYLPTSDLKNVLYPLGTIITITLASGLKVKAPVVGYYHPNYFHPMVCTLKALEQFDCKSYN